MTTLAVWLRDRPVGTLATRADGLLDFRYHAHVRDDPAAEVSPVLPIAHAGTTSPIAATAFFENLLPESELRDHLGQATHHDAGDVVGLLGVVGGDCAGAVSLWPADDPLGPTRPPRYVSATADAVARVLAGSRAGDAPAMRASLSGTVPKCVVRRAPVVGGENPVYDLPLDGAPSTTLLKRPRATFPGLLHAELLGVGLCAAAGLPTASHAASAGFPGHYETTRFDRVVDPVGGAVTLLRAEDGCQRMGLPSRAKYGPHVGGQATLQRLATACLRVSADRVADQARLWQWAVAMLAVGNEDAHAKNVSMLDGPRGWRVAPCYDVVCTLAYDELARTFAVPFGGARAVAELTPHALVVAAREVGFVTAAARRRASELAAAVLDGVVGAVPDVCHRVADTAGPHPVLDALSERVPANARMVRARMLG